MKEFELSFFLFFITLPTSYKKSNRFEHLPTFGVVGQKITKNAMLEYMGKAIRTYRNKMQAVLGQNILKSEGIESMISPGSAPGNTPIMIDPFTGLDSNWQLVTHNQDAEKALGILKSREETQ